MRVTITVMAALLAGGCMEAATSPETAPPRLHQIAPQGITFADIEKHDLFGAGCGFMPDGADKPDAVVFTDDVKASMLVGESLVQLPAITSSADFPYGSYQRYASPDLSLKLNKAKGKPITTGMESATWRGSLTVRDKWDRVVYQADGKVECGA